MTIMSDGPDRLADWDGAQRLAFGDANGRLDRRTLGATLTLATDAAVTLAVCAAMARGTSVIRGVRTLRVKETDRIEALRVELAKVGVTVETDVQGDDGTITVTPPQAPVESQRERVEFETYDDHRMAMALSLIGLRRPGVWIKDPGCVQKTYAAYFAHLSRLYAGSGT